MVNEVLKGEILSDEQLEQVAGGTNREICLDRDFMVAIAALPKDRAGNTNELKKSFARFGISAVLDDGYANNEYYDSKGKPMTREAALKFILSKSPTKINPYTGKRVVAADYL